MPEEVDLIDEGGPARPTRMAASDAAEMDLSWLRDIACADKGMDDFFVEAGHTISPEIVRMCQACPVREDCVRHVYQRKVDNGYFAALSPGQRRAMSLEEALAFIKTDVEPPARALPVRRPRRPLTSDDDITW